MIAGRNDSGNFYKNMFKINWLLFDASGALIRNSRVCALAEMAVRPAAYPASLKYDDVSIWNTSRIA
jgi:hypothetical protein